MKARSRKSTELTQLNHFEAFTTKKMKVEDYVSKYYPELEINEDFKFQEKVRVLTASAEGSDQDFANGWTSMKILKDLFAQEGEKLSQGLRECIMENTSQLPDYPANVRGPIKKIFTYPLKGYLKWNHIPIPWLSIPQIKPPRFEIVEGKVYVTVGRLADELHPKIMSLLPPEMCDNLIPNTEVSHLTIVNSDIVAKCDQEKLQSLIDLYNKNTVDIKWTDLRHTISLEWPRFSICAVLSAESSTINDFVIAFNEVFSQEILPQVVKPSLHVTISIQKR